MAHRPASFEETRTDAAIAAGSAPRVPVLIVIGGARTLGESRAVLRIDGSLEIGRRPDATGDRAWALDDDRVSRRHAVIEVDVEQRSARVTDLGSRNGTILDGRALGNDPRPARLSDGSLLFVGTHAAVFRFVTEADLEAIARDAVEPFTPVATTSPELARLTHILRHLAREDEDLLIMGETGVGKEQFARAIHRTSGRWGKFVAVNCAALPSALIESELFGYVKGAHSQASRDKLGLIDEAEHGTLFLDEFAELSPDVQAKLLRFLEDRDVTALGSTKHRTVDVRILAATNRERTALRQDIAARLGPEPIRLPPLRAHREDIGALAQHFLRERPGMGLDAGAFQALCLDAWPDNVRGLKKVLIRAGALAAAAEKPLIGLEHLPAGFGRATLDPVTPVVAPPPRPPAARRSPRAAPTKADLRALLERHAWVVAQAARELDRDHAVVWRWIKRYGLDVPRARS